MLTRIRIAIVLMALLSPLHARAQNSATGQFDPATLPAKDSHDNLLIAADPLTAAPQYKEVFGKNSPYEAGIIAVQVYCRNDNDLPIRVSFDSLELLVSLPGEERQHLAPLSAEEVANRALLKGDTNPSIPTHLPLPNIHKSGPGKAWNDMVTYLHTVALSTDALPPHKVARGFLFFDMNHNFKAIRYAHLYIPDLWFMTNKKALLFFEIDLGASGTP